MKPLSASSLSRRYTLLVAICALPLLLLVGALGAYQFDAQRRTEFEALAAAASETRLVVERVVKDATDHLVQLQIQAESLLSGSLPSAGRELRALLAPSRPGVGDTSEDDLTLDQTDERLRASLGNIFVAADRLDSTADGELEMALALFQPMRLTHLVKPNLQWSYYFSASGAFITMFPFVSREELVEGFGHASISAMIDGFLAYEVYLDTTPARNPELAPQWTPPYLDAAGAGWMVSYSVAVKLGQRHVGTLGTDLLLSYLDETLGRLPLRAGRLWVVNPNGELVADRAGTPVDGNAPRHVRSVLPGELGDADTALATLLAPGRHDLAGHRIVTWLVEGTPWTLLYVVSEQELATIVGARIIPYGIILIGLLASMFGAHSVLRAQFIRPAIALAQHLEADGASSMANEHVPSVWRPWFMRISTIINENRETMGRLAASEERFRSVVEAQTELVIRFTLDGRLTFVNDAYCRHLGKSRAALLDPGYSLFDHISPVELERQARHFAALTPDNPTASIELSVIRADGSTVCHDWTDRALFDSEGALVEIQAVGRDVTDRRRAQIALTESEERYRSVVEAQTEFVLRMTPDGKLTFVNDAYCRYHGRSRQELLSPDWCDYDVLSDEERARFVAYLERLTPDAPVASIELENLLPGHSRRWSAWNDRGIFDESGQLIEVQSVGRDITERVIAEQARQETERLRQTVLEAALDGYVGIDDEGRIIEFNAAAEAIFGYSRDRVLGQPLVDLVVPPTLRHKHSEAFERHLATGMSSILGRRIEVPAQRSDGSLFPIELVIARGVVSERPVFIAYLRDLTDQKKTAAALAERDLQFDAISEGVPLSIVISAIREPEVFFVNERAQQTLGLTVGQK